MAGMASTSLADNTTDTDRIEDIKPLTHAQHIAVHGSDCSKPP